MAASQVKAVVAGIAAMVIIMSLAGCSSNGSSTAGTDAAKLPVASASVVQQATAANAARKWKWYKAPVTP